MVSPRFFLVVALAGWIGAFAMAAPRAADWQRPIAGGAPTLPAHFVAPPRRVPVASLRAAEFDDEPAATPPVWSTPLFDRELRASDRTRDLAPSLRELLVRVVGLNDAVVGVDPNDGDAAWRGPAPDGPVPPQLTTASYTEGLGPCETVQPFYSVRRTSLTLAPAAECLRMRRAAAHLLRDLAATSMMSTHATLPVFLAPPPGARMSSEAFWAAQRKRVHAVEARLRNGWHERDADFTALDLTH